MQGRATLLLGPPSSGKSTFLKLLGVQGRATLLLGPPSSGKSTFLKLLAGRADAEAALSISGSVKYNGKSPEDFVLRRTAAYIDQDDNHLANLPVGETLRFAWQCQQRRRGATGFDVLAASDGKDGATASAAIGAAVRFLSVCRLRA